MEILTTRDQIAKTVKSARDKGDKIGFIPTMGALHEGHMSLLEEARKHCNYLVVSVFVNPTQFNDVGDLERYPRQLEADSALLEEHGCDALYTPSVDEVYHDPEMRTYDLGSLNEVLEGPNRNGHFQGVVNVVDRLFEQVQPDIACFGKKDRQQLAVIEHVAMNNGWKVEVLGCPTKRAKDGLALSSRNALLSEDERARSVGIFKALCLAEEDAYLLKPQTLKMFCVQIIERHGMEVEYFDIVHPVTFESLKTMDGIGHAYAVAAAYCGEVRLIDNIDLYR